MDLKINKKGLGRGLSSLMGEVSEEQIDCLLYTSDAADE